MAHRTSTEARSSHARPLEPARAEDEHRQVARAQRDPLAFAPLYQRYVRSIYAYCFQRLGSHEAAEDATSQVFLKALAALPRYRSESFRAWLFTIAHNVVMDAHRQRPAAPLDQAGEIADHRQSPEEAVILVDGRRSVRRLLERLTPDQRDVVALRLEGLPTGEIAQVLGRRPGAIRATQLRGYRRLRDLLESEVQL